MKAFHLPERAISEYLYPKADIVFVKIFAQHKHILISFLKAVLPLPSSRQIVPLTVIDEASKKAAEIEVKETAKKEVAHVYIS